MHEVLESGDQVYLCRNGIRLYRAMVVNGDLHKDDNCIILEVFWDAVLCTREVLQLGEETCLFYYDLVPVSPLDLLAMEAE